MSKAIQDSTTRRRVLAGAAGAIAVVASPTLAVETQEDPALLALGVELEKYIADWRAQRAVDAAGQAAWEAACERAGLPRLEYGSVAEEEWRARSEARMAIKVPGNPHDDDVDGDAAQ